MYHIHGDVVITNQLTTCTAFAVPIRFLTAMSTMNLLGWIEDLHIVSGADPGAKASML